MKLRRFAAVLAITIATLIGGSAVNAAPASAHNLDVYPFSNYWSNTWNFTGTAWGPGKKKQRVCGVYFCTYVLKKIGSRAITVDVFESVTSTTPYKSWTRYPNRKGYLLFRFTEPYVGQGVFDTPRDQVLCFTQFDNRPKVYGPYRQCEIFRVFPG